MSFPEGMLKSHASVARQSRSRVLLGLRVLNVPYGSRTRVAAVKEKRPIVIQQALAAWIALYRTLKDSREHLLDL